MRISIHAAFFKPPFQGGMNLLGRLPSPAGIRFQPPFYAALKNRVKKAAQTRMDTGLKPPWRTQRLTDVPPFRAATVLT